ncbi:mechanosensitive ion channel [Lutibacter sp. A80]|uniref:mechanosensitive ion channel family protein n=1 Tax=Lutibacter sp. A80 TaxID=2918453 RepID=UPI001F064975|nr:mechanosensitive ion channel domain-containing protein [Lutibacter sp. A80]UMB59245.1 mechanosensitive ion channel [Lutibacter sp. A80]
MDYQKYLDLVLNFVTNNIGNVIVALLILIIGLWLVKKVVKVIRKVMDKRGVDVTLQKFLGDLIGWILKIIIFITAISQVGVETTSFIAILGAAGLAVGLALQGSLANFAGGALIMIFKPFKVGDFIEAQGHMGTVKEIQIFVTKLNSPQNRLIILPNGTLSNGDIINYSEEDIARVDLTFGVSYDADIKQTKDVLMKILLDHPKVLKDPAPAIKLSELADSSVNYIVRPWVATKDYWTVHFDVMEAAKIELDKAGIEIPYPHQVEIKK